MRKNIGNTDRVIRGMAAVVILILFLTGIIRGQAAVFAGIAALVLLFTSLTSFCPCYIRLNINTSGKKEEEVK